MLSPYLSEISINCKILMLLMSLWGDPSDEGHRTHCHHTADTAPSLSTCFNYFQHIPTCFQWKLQPAAGSPVLPCDDGTGSCETNINHFVTLATSCGPNWLYDGQQLSIKIHFLSSQHYSNWINAQEFSWIPWVNSWLGFFLCPF